MSAWVPRLVLAAGAVVIAYAIVSIAVGEGGPQPVEISGIGDAQRLYGGIVQDGPYLGDEDAEVTVTVFNDLQSTEGAAYHLETVAPLVEGYARTGDARLELRHFSLGTQPTTQAALAATAAGEQGRQWQYAHLFLRNQDLAGSAGVTDELLREIADAVPELELEQWDADLESAAVAARLQADAELATELRLPAEPAVVVAGRGGQRELVESPSLEEIAAAVAAVS